LVELADVYALRTLIEPDLARRAAFARNETHVARARHAYEVMDEAADGNPEVWVTAHREFHWSLLDVELGPVSARIVRELWGVSDRYVFLAASAFRTDKPARDHHRLMEAFVAKDGEAIAVEWTDHLRLVEHDIRRDFGDAFDVDVSSR
jgi:DNA-binding GntR family transcriptional regulator